MNDSVKVKRERAPAKEIFGWAMFDFANSSFTTVIITVVFAELFPLIVGADPNQSNPKLKYALGNMLWAITQSIGLFLVVISGPLIGAIMDYSASKKKFLFVSYLITVLASACLYFVGPNSYGIGMIIIVIALVGFYAGENFVSSFLPDLGPPEDLGRISAYAWSLGYLGGLLSAGFITFVLGDAKIENFQNMRFVGPITAVFFLLAAIPTFLLVKERGRAQVLPRGASYLKIGFQRLGQTLKEVRSFRDLMIFLIVIFFSFGGLNIIIAFAFIYGNQEIGWSGGTRILMFIITQFTAAGGALLFGYIQDRIGAKKTFNMTLVLWIITITTIWGTEPLTKFLNSTLNTNWKMEHVFLIVACLAGMGIGSTQSASRAIVGIFSPESKSGEFFGLWGLAGKLSAIPGLLAVAYLQFMEIRLRETILICTLFFVLALITNFFVNEEQGKKAALEHEGE